MKLTAAHIQNLRCVEDSGEFSLSGVTCLVGKNESGKTTVLRALHKLNPDNPSDANFLPLDDYPRRRYASYRPRQDKHPDPVLTTKWTLEEADLAEVAKRLGASTLRSPAVTISKGYDNQIRVSGDVDESTLVGHLLESARLGTPDTERVAGATSLTDLAAKLAAPPALSPPLAQLQSTLKQLSPDGIASGALTTCVAPLLPKFLYFADFEKMSGQVALDEFLARKASKQLAGGQRIFSALLELAGTSAEQLKAVTKFEALKAELEAVSNNITEQVFSYWTQNQRLSVEFDLRPGMPNDQAPLNSGMIFRTRVRNELHEVTVNFDERSSGFIWFFSFLVWFSQLKETYGDKIVILLDEPGLSLHGRAQEDLLRFVNERLRPHHQVVYTTHSPFMVDPDNLLGVRTVEDRSTSDNVVGTIVSDRVLSSDKDTIFPLQAAIGYDIAQTLFVGKHTVLVEGPSDLLYLKWASSELKRMHRTGLDPRWVIAPTGGIDKFWSFVALFGGNKLDLAVVSDFHHNDKNKLRGLRDSKIIPSNRVLTAEAYAGAPEADVEDLLGREFYLTLIDKAFVLTGGDALVGRPSPMPVGRVIEEVEAHFMRLAAGAGPLRVFDHFSAASYLLEHAAEGRGLPGWEAALDRFERLFQDLNSFLPPQG